MRRVGEGFPVPGGLSGLVKGREAQSPVWKLLLGAALTVAVLLGGVELALRAWGRMLLAGRRAGAGANVAVACLGDSYTYGSGVEPAQAYPNRLDALLREGFVLRDVTAVNLGYPGLEASSLLTLLPDLLERYSPRVAVVMIGHNFYLFKGDLDEVMRRYRELALGGAGREEPASVVDGLRLVKVLRYAAGGLRRRFSASGGGDGRAASRLGPDVLPAAGRLGLNRVEEAHLLRARDLERDGDGAAAAAELRSVIASNPRNAEAHYRLGLLLRRSDAPAGRASLQRAYALARAQLYEKRLRETVAYLRSHSVTPVLMTYPYEDFVLSAVVRGVARDTAAELIDLEALFAKALEGRPDEAYFLPDGHCNAAGNELIARTLFEFFAARPRLLDGPNAARR